MTIQATHEGRPVPSIQAKPATLRLLCTLANQPSPGPLLRVLYFLRVPSLFGESSKVFFSEGS